MWVLLFAAMMLLFTATTGCHTAYQCPILQPMSGGTIPAPLPPAPNDPNDKGSGESQRFYVGGIVTHPAPEGDAYKVVGYREGIRFYIVQYNEKLYRGGDILNRNGAKALKGLGIKTIISVTPDNKERALAKEFGFKLVEIPFGLNDLNKKHLDRFLEAAEKSPGPIYVHCFSGDLRAAALLAHWRMHKEGWSYQRAEHEYLRLDANIFDSGMLLNALKTNAPKSK
jgi:protein tyrosine phosphatase (PTP) superfamily phosphohydrolase (DUF442 family)